MSASPNGTAKVLMPRQRQAARLVAEDRLTDVLIAQTAGVTKRTLERWKQQREFRDAVLAVRREVEAELLSQCRYASKVQRVLSLAGEIEALASVFAARAADPSAVKAPGGDTGRVVIVDRVIGSGDMATMVTESKVDTGAISLKAQLLQQIAQELGQWTEKHSVSFDAQSEAEKLAAEFGLSVEEVLREAELLP